MIKCGQTTIARNNDAVHCENIAKEDGRKELKKSLINSQNAGETTATISEINTNLTVDLSKNFSPMKGLSAFFYRENRKTEIFICCRYAVSCFIGAFLGTIIAKPLYWLIGINL